jgi:hypothetical protein
VNIAEAKKARAILKNAILALVTELADLPSKVTNPGWLDEVAAEEHIELMFRVCETFPPGVAQKNPFCLGVFAANVVSNKMRKLQTLGFRA